MSKTTSKTGFLHFLPLTATLVVAFLLDQLSKIWLNSNLLQPLPIFGDFFKLQLEHNIGMAFSITFPYPVQLAINIVFFSAIIIYLAKTLNFTLLSSQIIFALLAAGAIGNLFDRLRLGYVIDFISVGSFPVFNLADSCITVSIFLLLLFYDRMKRPK